ncbi:MAG TPA: hypothetical protein VGM50_06675 [Gemmatimonadaceae bacterium]|jgi:hypothetical protein
MGCIARLGCLFVLACAAVVGWLTRDHWLPEKYRARFSTSAKAPTWQPLSAAGADRTRAALDKLSQRNGPVFQTLSGADVASYVFRQLASKLPESADSVQALVVGERISLRSVVDLQDLGSNALGPLSSVLGKREPIELSGTLRVVKPGQGEFQIQQAKVGAIGVPGSMIPTLIQRFDRGARPAGVDANALPLPLPAYIGDIRVANGKITLYKNVQ